MSLPGDFREFLSLLISHRVEFLLVGAHALAVHGRPRFTGDLDVWVFRDPENAARLVAALDDVDLAGLRIPVLGRDDFITSKKAAARPKDLLDLQLLDDAEDADD